MTSVRYDHASRTYEGTSAPAVDTLDLDIGDGELLVLVGPSGSGKSTALRMLAGLEPLDAGSIHIGERDVSNVRPCDRDIAMVFQNYALYPQLSVAENMGFALKQAGVPKAERITRVREVARVLDLEPYLDRKPKHLSGGQRQRVAMGRALVRGRCRSGTVPCAHGSGPSRPGARGSSCMSGGSIGATRGPSCRRCCRR